MKIELDRDEALYIYALVARERADVSFSANEHKKVFGTIPEEYEEELELCNSIIDKLNPFFDRKERVVNEVCEM